MLDIYISHKAFHDCVVNESDSFIRSIITSKEKGFVLYGADKPLMESICQETSLEFNASKNYDLLVRRGIETAELVKQNCKEKKEIRCGLSTAIFILGGITPEAASSISKRLGVMCFSDTQIPSASSFKSIIKTLEAGEEYKWEYILKNFISIPVNSIIINDRYLHKNPNKTIINLQNIVRSLITEDITYTIHILLLFSSDAIYSNRPDEEYKNKVTILNGLRAFLKDTLSINNLCVEMLLYKKDSDLYKNAHNRFIITNYGIISAEQTLSVFTRNSVSDVLQTVISSSIFSDDTTDGFEKWIKYLQTITRNIKKAFHAEYNNIECYSISSNEVNTISLCNMKNKLLELREGDNCYYLSVPNQNDWANIKILPGTYSQGPYSNCICAKTEDLLRDRQSKIQDLFKNMNIERYRQCPKGEKNFYRITVSDDSNFDCINVQSPDGSKSDNQIQYTNNCFLRQNDAIEIARKISSILRGIPIKVIDSVSSNESEADFTESLD